MIHTPFFVLRDLLSWIPFPECMALRGEWLHWSTELWRVGIPIVCMKRTVAFECRSRRDTGENASAKVNAFSYYHLLVSLLHMFARYDIDPESKHGQVIRKRYLDKYHPSDAKTVWHTLAEVGSHIRNGTKVSVDDVLCIDNSFGELLGNAYRRIAECGLVCKNTRPKAQYDVGPDDYDFPWIMAEHSAVFKAVKECLYYYRDHRECYRLTTHLPLSVHKREIRRIFEKHVVAPLTIKEKIARAEGTYLWQCLYRSPCDKRIKEKQGYDARQGWREKYK
jgi:hypothetical protein